MRTQLVTVLCLALILPAANADDDLYSAGKIRGHITINPSTGARTIDAREAAPRAPSLLWDNSTTPPFFGLAQAYERLDWGDIAAAKAAHVSSFTFAYEATSYTPDPDNGNVSITTAFYINENGHNSPMPPSTATFTLTTSNLPGVSDPNLPPGYGWGWIVTWDLTVLHNLDPNFPASLPIGATAGNTDLDGDGLLDFGYSYFVPAAGPDNSGNPPLVGPLYAYANPDPNLTPGWTSDYNRYAAPGKWSVGNAGFIGTYNNGAQIWLQLMGCLAGDTDADGVCDDTDQCPTVAGPSPTGCPTCPDLTNDHQVDLVDVAILLSNYGHAPVSYAQGDVNHDNQVDLSDLAILLSAYGTSCP